MLLQWPHAMGLKRNTIPYFRFSKYWGYIALCAGAEIAVRALPRPTLKKSEQPRKPYSTARLRKAIVFTGRATYSCSIIRPFSTYNVIKYSLAEEFE